MAFDSFTLSLIDSARVVGLDVIDDLLVGSFPLQESFCRDPSRYRALMCARQAGKSTSAAICAISTAWRFSRCSVLITGLVMESARKSFEATIDDLLEKLPLSSFLPVTKKGSLTYSFPNGSNIVIKGASTGGVLRVQRFKGTKYKLAIVDEPQGFPDVLLDDLVNEVLLPALDTQRGDLILCGTPGFGTETYWHHIVHSTPEERLTHDGLQWSNWNWSRFDSPFVRDQTEERMEMLSQTDPAVLEDPRFRREFLGIWDNRDHGERIFNIAPHNLCVELPEWASMPRWHVKTLLGMDFGSVDASAFVVCRYSIYDEKLYIIHCEQHTKMLTDDVFDKARELITEFDVDAWVGDSGGLGKMLVETLIVKLDNTENIAVDKRKKSMQQCMLNSELRKGKIAFAPQPFRVLSAEWQNIVWDPELYKLGELEELERRGVPNHLSDATRYVWTAADHYRKQAAPAPRAEEPTRRQALQKRARDAKADERWNKLAFG